MSKTFALNSMIPRITSTTKSEVSSSRSGLVSRAARPARRRSLPKNLVSFISAASLTLIVLGMGFYVFMINASASKGYELKHQQALVDDLTETQKGLMIQQAALGSITKVNDVASTAGMVPVTGEEFLVANQISKR